MPFGWALDGIMPGWVFSSTGIGESGAAWIALATHQSVADGPPTWLIREAEHPHQALNLLAVKLRAIKGSASG